MATLKRFIAGAVCPSCGEMDKIVTYREGECTFRECVKCDYRDQMVEQAFSEIPTRVTPGAKATQPEVQAIKFFPSPRGKNPSPK